MHIVYEMGVVGEILYSKVIFDYSVDYRCYLLSRPPLFLVHEGLRAIHTKVLRKVAGTLVTLPKVSFQWARQNCTHITYDNRY